MILNAIPKSAGTSLTFTLAKLHRLEENDHLETPKKICEKSIKNYSNRKPINHFHIFPTKENIRFLKKIKKVVLLRNPEDAYFALERGIKSFSHGPGMEDIFDRDYFQRFYGGGIKEQNKNTLIVTSGELIKNPKDIINEIERFWDLDLSKNVKLVKKRYGRNNLINFGRKVYYVLRKIKILRILKRKIFSKYRFYVRPNVKNKKTAKETLKVYRKVGG